MANSINQSQTACFSLENIDSIPGIEPITDKAASAYTGGYRVEIELNNSGNYVQMKPELWKINPSRPVFSSIDAVYNTRTGKATITKFVVRESRQERTGSRRIANRSYIVRAKNDSKSELFRVKAGEETNIGFKASTIFVDLV